MQVQERRPTFQGDGASLFGVFIVGILLTMITFGIYSFWFRTKLRRYIWNAVEFEDDRFTYHGTGGELLAGWAKAMGIFIGLAIVIGIFGAMGDAMRMLGVLVFYGVILCLIPFAILGARRYRLRRTSWRGIRFGQQGEATEFMKVWIPGALLTGITLTLYRPYFEMKTHGWLWNRARFGTAKFGFDGEGDDLFKQYLFAILLTIPTLGLYWFWYQAFRTRYVWDHTTLEGARFSSTVTGGGLLGVTLVSMLMIMFSLGLAAPWAIVRYFRYYTDNISLVGSLDFAAMVQTSAPATAMGEGLADVLDMDGFDLGL